MKYKVKIIQVVYRTGARDKITLAKPIFTDDLWALRAKLQQKYAAPGVGVSGVNFDAEEVE